MERFTKRIDVTNYAERRRREAQVIGVDTEELFTEWIVVTN